MNRLTRELVERAYSLAFFIHQDHQIASSVVTEALDKLEVAALSQDKRLYYRLSGRVRENQDRARQRAKISLSELHLLQLLIYIESEIHEKAQEEQGQLNQAELILRFIKYLVKISARRNSFYVALAISRLLHNYSTAETMEIYNLLIQDAERVKDDHYYRSRKKQLLAEVQARFGERLKMVRVERGEERFEAINSSTGYYQFVQDCLHRFTPWDTACVIPEHFDRDSEILAPLQFAGADPDQEHPIEIKRIHSILHNDCYRRLTMSLKFGAPDTRITIPKLQSKQGQNGDDPPRRHDDRRLSDDQFASIEALLAGRDAQRRNAQVRWFSIIVDGVARAQIDLYQTDRVNLVVPAGAELIEVRRSSDQLLLATCLLNYPDETIERQEIATELPGGEIFSFTITTSNDPDRFLAESNVEIKYYQSQFYRRWLLVGQRLFHQLGTQLIGAGKPRSILRPALTFLLMILVTAIIVFYYRYNQSPNNQPIIAKEQPQQPAPNRPEITTPLPTANPAPSPEQDQAVAENRNHTPNPILGAEPDEQLIFRGGQDEQAVTSLSAVRLIYVDELGGSEFSRQLRAALISRLRQSGRFQFPPKRDDADAVLRGLAKLDGNGNITLSLKLINADGQTLWSVASKRSTGSDQAKLTALIDTIVTRLDKDIERAKKK